VSWRQRQDEVNRLADEIFRLYKERAATIREAGGRWLMDDTFALKMAQLKAKKADLWDTLRREFCYETQECLFFSPVVRHRVSRPRMGFEEVGHVPQARLHAPKSEK